MKIRKQIKEKLVKLVVNVKNLLPIMQHWKLLEFVKTTNEMLNVIGENILNKHFLPGYSLTYWILNILYFTQSVTNKFFYHKSYLIMYLY